MSNELYFLIGIIIVLFLYDQLVLKSKKSTNNIEATVHKPKELKKYRPHRNDDGYIHVSQNIRLDIEKKASKNNLILVAASSGSGKTYGLINNNILLNNRSSKVITDVGRTMYPEMAPYLKWKGYEIKELNLYDFKNGDSFNPLWYVCDSEGNYIRNRKIDYYTEIDEDFLITIVRTIVPMSPKNENDFWIEATRNTILTLMLYMFYCDDYANKRNLVEVAYLFNDMMSFDDYGENRHYRLETIVEDMENDIPNISYRDEKGLKHFEPDRSAAVYNVYERMESLANDLTSDGDYASSLKGSFKNTFSDKVLKANVIRTISADSMALESIDDVNNRTAYFITMKDTSRNYNFISSLFYVTMFNVIDTLASKTEKGKLDRSIEFYLDEFGSSVYIPSFASIMATIRKKMGTGGGSIFFIVVQDFRQLKEKYGENDESIIVSNCSMKIYLGIDDSEGKKRIEEWGGTKIRSMRSDSTSSKNISHSYSEQYSNLLDTNYLNEMEANGNHECLFFMNGRVYRDRMIGYDRMKEWKEYQSYLKNNKNNT